MAKVEVKNLDGQPVKEHELPDAVFSVRPNHNLLWEATKAYLASRRRGTHSTKSRGARGQHPKLSLAARFHCPRPQAARLRHSASCQDAARSLALRPGRKVPGEQANGGSGFCASGT